MRLGYSIPGNQGFKEVDELIALAVLAESLGFEELWASEHLFHSSYIADRLGDLPYFEPLTILTAVAMATKTARLGTSVLVLPWHDPPRLGKVVATLDHISKGRVDLGVGVALTEDEFNNLGVDFKTRGRRTNEILEALQALWTQDIPAYKGEFYQYEGLRFSPKPLQKPYPPILVGGSSKAALRRTARFGDGWHTLRQTPNQIAAAMPELRAMTEEAGRDPARLRISISIPVQFAAEGSSRAPGDRTSLRGSPQDIAETIHAFADAGVGEMSISFGSRDKGEHEDTLRRLAEEVAPLAKG